ncbi:MAG: DEAD/DEAH box helicase [Candidatus Omnitrophica bacterium]|nr:DEAD/DEAH box helicase [Candidatus Omnitrophota bacterium]
MNSNIETIRNRLKFAWMPFFTRFGKLTPVQEKTIPKILDGFNVVVVSPTASGKTEAVVAPVAERLKSENWHNLSVLFVSPTRALANDMLTRIEGPLQYMNIKIKLKHGDKPYFSSKLPNWLITTPESLDSLICRKPEVFTNLRTVILDEIHLLDNTYRGDQLRLLLYRLRELVFNRTFNIHLLSATLSEPKEVAQRYVNEFEMVIVPGQREIDYYIVDSHEEVYNLAKQNGWKKILYFCNKRETVEEIANFLGKLWPPCFIIVAHHGSLSSRERKEAEIVMKERKMAICVATSTLEVGIDIGDIELVVLAEPPYSISSLLQRIGRGNRRDDIIHAIAIAKSDEERKMLEAMFQMTISGELPRKPYIPDLSVAIQQIFSYLYQHREGVAEEKLFSLLSPICASNEIEVILEHLNKKEFIMKVTGYWFATTKLMDLGEKGLIHSNIPDTATYRVIDIDSGKEIGKIAGIFDEVFVLAQRAWRVVEVKGNEIKVQRFKGKAFAPYFKPHYNIGAFYHFLPPRLKQLYF